MRRLALYSFVITLIWLGFVCAISFMEAPLKFNAPGVELKQALSIGRIVFRALNRMEWISAALSWIIALRLGVLRTPWPDRALGCGDSSALAPNFRVVSRA